MVRALRRENAAANGFLNDAAARLEENVFTITLTHGGADILKDTGCDAFLRALVQKRFGVAVEIRFDGEVTVTPEAPAFVKMQEQADAQQKAEREAAKRKAEGDKLKGEHKMYDGLPLYLETAREILGRPVRNKPTRSAISTRRTARSQSGETCSAMNRRRRVTAEASSSLFTSLTTPAPTR